MQGRGPTRCKLQRVEVARTGREAEAAKVAYQRVHASGYEASATTAAIVAAKRSRQLRQFTRFPFYPRRLSTMACGSSILMHGVGFQKKRRCFNEF